MEYKEIHGDLFSLSTDEYQFAQCISADFRMGKGIALQFNSRFNIKSLLKQKYSSFLPYWDSQDDGFGWCIYCNNVYNLITKRIAWDKPTEQSLTSALQKMKELCVKRGTKKLAMPKIACGLDGMQWSFVSKCIKETFCDTDIEIVVAGK